MFFMVSAALMAATMVGGAFAGMAKVGPFGSGTLAVKLTTEGDYSNGEGILTRLKLVEVVETDPTGSLVLFLSRLFPELRQWTETTKGGAVRWFITAPKDEDGDTGGEARELALVLRPLANLKNLEPDLEMFRQLVTSLGLLQPLVAFLWRLPEKRIQAM